MSGYLYRVYPADAAQLRALIAQFVSPPCWTFGGAARWDFEPARGQANLRPITPLADAAAIAGLDLTGDFGHAFSPQAEVRWRRRDATTYDVLVLSERSLTVANSTVLAAGWATSVPRAGVLQSGAQSQTLRVIAYHAPNGAVQFLRYTEA